VVTSRVTDFSSIVKGSILTGEDSICVVDGVEAIAVLLEEIEDEEDIRLKGIIDR